MKKILYLQIFIVIAFEAIIINIPKLTLRAISMDMTLIVAVILILEIIKAIINKEINIFKDYPKKT